MKSIDDLKESTDVATDKKESDQQNVHDIRDQIRLIEKGVICKEPRFILRVLRTIPSTRKKLNVLVLKSLLNQIYPIQERDNLLKFFNELPSEQMDVRSKATKSPMPEIDAYLHLLLVIYLIDNEKLEDGWNCSQMLMDKISAENRRILDLIAAKSYFYYSRCAELTNRLDKIRPFLHARLRTATLRNDYEGQAVLINCLLRNYLHYSLYSQADKLVNKCDFPETASNNEWARFFYYLGRIKSTHLEYTLAQKHLVQAIRKAPQHAAIGFRQTVHKLTVVVELLLGDIPERMIFRQATMRRSLAPYFQLTQAVRLGNLQRFGEVLENFGTQFQHDNTYILILRLRHNVIKTAIRKINLSYSRISLQDISSKLGLDSDEDAKFIVSKAIRDSVIEAVLDSTKSAMQSKEMNDIYNTNEPQSAYHQRISFCLNLHNQSVKAMRYPPKSYGKELESAEERREREQQDLELAKEIADDDDDGFP